MGIYALDNDRTACSDDDSRHASRKAGSRSDVYPAARYRLDWSYPLRGFMMCFTFICVYGNYFDWWDSGEIRAAAFLGPGLYDNKPMESVIFAPPLYIIPSHAQPQRNPGDNHISCVFHADSYRTRV